jgi:hypothetical protein
LRSLSAAGAFLSCASVFPPVSSFTDAASDNPHGHLNLLMRRRYPRRPGRCMQREHPVRRCVGGVPGVATSQHSRGLAATADTRRHERPACCRRRAAALRARCGTSPMLLCDPCPCASMARSGFGGTTRDDAVPSRPCMRASLTSPPVASWTSEKRRSRLVPTSPPATTQPAVKPARVTPKSASIPALRSLGRNEQRCGRAHTVSSRCRLSDRSSSTKPSDGFRGLRLALAKIVWPRSRFTAKR